MSKRSLKFQVIALAIGIILILGITSTILVEKLVFTNREMIFDNLKSDVSKLQSVIAAQFFDRYKDVQAFSLNHAITSMDKNKIVPSLNKYVTMYGIYDLILVVSPDGKLLASNDISPDNKTIQTSELYSKNYKDEPWFKAVMNESFTKDPTNGFNDTFVEDPSFDGNIFQAYGEKRFASSFSAAIKDAQGKIIGVISNRTNSKWFELEIQKYYESEKNKGFSELEITMLDKNGVVLVDYDPSTHQDNMTFIHDETTLNKLNLAEEGLAIAKDLINKKGGSGSFLHARKKINQVAGYSPIVDNKFISSLGWGLMIRAREDVVFKKVYLFQKMFYTILSLILGMAIFMAYKISTSISNNLQKISTSLSHSSELVNAAASKIAASSETFSQASTQQAASIQETSASIEEISSMVNSSTENAKQAASISEKNLISTQQGKEVVDHMINAINDINLSNDQIAVQINETNKEIENIVIIINNIGVKTKVINDIVFQTKLLSFNASVEAARAGEQGKGFAVVAEEIGNLASMSGNAAQEITELLNGSIQAVEDIVKKSKERIEKLINSSKQSVDNGTRVAHQCEDAFNIILDNTSNISKMVIEISHAGQEQAQGVNEVNKAIGLLDQVTHENTSNASQNGSAAESLSLQAKELNSLVKILIETIEGESKKTIISQNKSQKKSNLISEPLPKPLTPKKSFFASKKSNPTEKKKEKLITANVPSKSVKKEPIKEPIKEAIKKPIKNTIPSNTENTENAFSSALPSHDDSRFEDV